LVKKVDDMQPKKLTRVIVPALIVAEELDNPGILMAASVIASGIQGIRKVIIPGAA
jgi:hypothetical protein